MNDRPDTALGHEQSGVPRGSTLAEWRSRHTPPSRRRAQVTSGMIAAVATLAPVVLSVRGARAR